jgi:hypothetical protein
MLKQKVIIALIIGTFYSCMLSANESLFEGFTITGVVTDINLNDEVKMTSQLEKIWQKYSDNERLHEIVSWNTGVNMMYAYYFDFDADYTSAKLILGYKTNLSIEGLHTQYIKSGEFIRHQLDPDGFPPELVWESSRPDDVILERHKVYSSGKFTDVDVLLIQPSSSKDRN